MGKQDERGYAGKTLRYGQGYSWLIFMYFLPASQINNLRNNVLAYEIAQKNT